MAKIQVKIEYPIRDGTSFTFHAPCNCSEVDGLTVTHPLGKQDFVFKDAHGNVLTGINNLFVRGSLIQAVLDVSRGSVFLQNADTNSYVERIVGVERGRIDELVVRNNTAIGDLDTLELDDDDPRFPFRATIISNGVNCYLGIEVSEVDLGVGIDNEAASNIHALPLNFAPLDTVSYETDTYIFSMTRVSIDKDIGTADVRFWLKSKVDDVVSVQTVSMYYPVLYPSTPETRDIRVGCNGKTIYPTAGEAVREQIGNVVDQVNGMDEDVANHTHRIAVLEKGGGITVDDELNSRSTNPVQNGVVAQKFAELDAELSSDIHPRIEALEEGGGILVDGEFSLTSRNPVQNKVIASRVVGIETQVGAAQAIAGRAEALAKQALGQGGSGTLLDGGYVINVRDHGAVGDGKTDDTDAIQAALYEAEASGLPLYIPAGDYKVSKTIATHKRDTEDAGKQTNALHIFGSGMNTRFFTDASFNSDGKNPYVFYIDVKYNAQPYMLWVHDFSIDLEADVSGIYFKNIGMKAVVENLWIRHKYDKDPTDPNVRAGICIEESTVSTFQRIKIMGNRERPGSGHENIGIVCHRSFSTKFIDCDIIFCKWGIYLNSGSDNTIERCRIDENEYGVYQNGTSTQMNYMPATRAYPADGSVSDGYNRVYHKGTFRNLTIRNNRFEGNNQQAIFLAAYGVGKLTYLYNAQITIENNDFSALGYGKAFLTTKRKVFRKAIHLYQCKGVVIANNAFTGRPYEEVNVDGKINEEVELQNLAGARVDDLTIRGNVVTTLNIGTEDATNIVKGNTKISSGLLNDHFEAYHPKSLADQGIVDNIEVDQSTRDRWRDELAALEDAAEKGSQAYESVVALNNWVDDAEDRITALEESGGITVDSKLDSSSTNPVQNKVIFERCYGLDYRTQSIENELDLSIRPRLDALEQGGTGGVDIEELKPFRFTVTKSSGQYTTSVPYDEIVAAHADDRRLICVYSGKELQFSHKQGDTLYFYGLNHFDTLEIAVHPSKVYFYSDYKCITINEVSWEEGNSDVDFTDTINEMIDAKVQGGGITVDDKLDGASTNPIQNGVVARAFLQYNGGFDAMDSRITALESSMGSVTTAHQRIDGLHERTTAIEDELELSIRPTLESVEALGGVDIPALIEAIGQADFESLKPLIFNVTETDSGYVSDKTLEELADALADNRFLICAVARGVNNYKIYLPLIESHAPTTIYGYMTFGSTIDDTTHTVKVSSQGDDTSVSVSNVALDTTINKATKNTLAIAYAELDYITAHLNVSVAFFSIGSVAYQFDVGMTWAEWCDSDYNTDGARYDETGVYDADDCAIYSVSTGKNVKPSNPITIRRAYAADV